MATTTNYGWSTPDNTALVKDGASAIRTLGSSIDTTVFNNASSTIAKTIVDAKGDIIAATAADTVSRLAVGANDTVLTADSTAATGLKWAAPAAASGPAFFAYRTSNQSLTANTVTQVQFNAEEFDTDNYFSSNAFTPLKAGYYQINGTLGFYSTSAGAEFQVRIYKNGAAYTQGTDTDLVGGFGGGSAGTIMYFNGSTDYATLYAYVSAGTCNIQGSFDQCQFSGVWIRS
jgi:hypothetical protein